MSQHESVPVSVPHSYTTCFFTLLTCKYLCIIIIIPPFASMEMSSKDQELHDVVFSRRHDKIYLLATLVNLDGPQ